MAFKVKFKKSNSLIITVCIAIFLLILSFFGASVFSQSPKWINNIQTMLDNSVKQLLLWRLGLLVIIFITWPILIKHKAKIQQWPTENIKRAINLRWIIVVFFLIFDGLFQWIG